MQNNNSNKSIPKYNGPIAVLDMLGFKMLVKNNTLDDIINTYARVITGAAFTAKVLNEDLEFMVYSDTIAIRLVNQNEKGFFNFIKALHLICESYFYQCQIPGETLIPIRGAISFGEYSWYNGDITTQVLGREPITANRVNFIAGKAIIDAHEHEMKQQWIGVSMKQETAELLKNLYPTAFAELIKTKHLVNYDIPLSQTIEKGYVINPTERSIFKNMFTSFLDICTEIFKDTREDKATLKIKLKYYNTLLLLNNLHENDNICPYYYKMKPKERETFIVDINKTKYLEVIKMYNS